MIKIALTKNFKNKNGHKVRLVLFQGPNESFVEVSVEGDLVGRYIDTIEALNDADNYSDSIDQFGVGA